MIESVSAEIHKEITGLKSAYEIFKRLKRKYGGDRSDSTYWITRLNSLSARKESDIPDVIEEMKDIFNSMDQINLKISEDEKMKYFNNSLPESYQNKIMLTK